MDVLRRLLRIIKSVSDKDDTQDRLPAHNREEPSCYYYYLQQWVWVLLHSDPPRHRAPFIKQRIICWYPALTAVPTEFTYGLLLLLLVLLLLLLAWLLCCELSPSPWRLTPPSRAKKKVSSNDEGSINMTRLRRKTSTAAVAWGGSGGGRLDLLTREFYRIFARVRVLGGPQVSVRILF